MLINLANFLWCYYLPQDNCNVDISCINTVLHTLKLSYYLSQARSIGGGSIDIKSELSLISPPPPFIFYFLGPCKKLR